MQQGQNAGLLLAETARAFKSGQYAQAEAGFRRLLDLASDLPSSYVNLTAALHAQGKYDEAIGWCEQGLQRFPQNLDLLGNLAVNLDSAGRYDDALRVLERAVGENPGHARSHHHIGTLCLKTDRFERSAESFKRAAEINPRDVLSHSGCGEALLKSGHAAEAIEAFDSALKVHPFDVRSIALKTLALAEAGRTEDERWLSDPFRLAQAVRLSDIGLTADAQRSLNAELARFALNHPSMQKDPPENATYQGWHSGNLGAERHPALDALRNFIGYALEQRRKSLASEDPGHPFVRATPRGFNLHLWSVKLVGEGKMLPHIHSDGWLSGVYYVDVPEVVNDESAGQAGWLRLGPARHDILMTRKPIVRAMKPEPGLMFTFPSYIWHETVPLPASAKQRLCYAYDLQPA
jgi:tetratricopeptide (TPR) repeat protein